MKKLIAALVAVFTISAYAAPEIVRLDSLEAAAYGASYVTIIDYDDLAAFTATNGAHGITSSVPAKVGLTMAGMILETAFNDAIPVETEGAVTNSLLLTIGDGSTANYYLTSTELAADATEVFVQFAPVGGVTITPQTLALTGEVQNVAVVTNIATSRVGAKYYSGAGSVVYTLTAGATTSPHKMTQGKLKVYWRELK